jgi:hypothetical protein
VAATIDPVLSLIPALITTWDTAEPLIRRIGVDQGLQGRVLAVRGSRVLISLLGERITAETLLPLHIGQTLRLVVREIRPERITLQVEPEVREGVPDPRALTDQDLSELLSAQQVPADATTLLIARTLLDKSLPVTGELILAARDALSFAGTLNPQDVEAVIFLALRALPVTPQSLELAKGALEQQNIIGFQIQALASQLRDLLAQTKAGDPTAILLRPLLASAQETLEGLPQVALDQSPGHLVPALVAEVLDRIATPTEHRLARVLGEADVLPKGVETQPANAGDDASRGLLDRASGKQPEFPRPDPSDTGPQEAMHAPAGLPVEEDVPIPAPPTPGPRPFPEEWPGFAPQGNGGAERVARERGPFGPDTPRDATLTLSQGLRPEFQRERLPKLTTQHVWELARDFRQQLARLNAELAQAAADLPRHHAMTSLLRKLQMTVRGMMSMVEAEQLNNAGLPPPNQAQGYYVFHLPVAHLAQDVTDTAEIRVYYQRGHPNKRVDPESAHLAFLLQLSHLGTVDVHVDLFQKHLRCRIGCSTGEISELFNQSSPELQERLQEAGYIVDSIRSAVARPTEQFSERRPMRRGFQIDIRA